MGSVTRLLSQKLVLFLGSISFSISRILLALLSFVFTYLFRFRGYDGSLKNNSEVISEDNKEKESECIEQESKLEQQPEAETETIGFTDSDGAEEKLEFSFQFRFPTYEEFSKSKKENTDLFDSELAPSTSTSRYEFMSGKCCSEFIQEPEISRFDVSRVLTGSNYADSVQEEGILSDKHLQHVPAEAADVFNVQAEDDTVNGVCDGEETVKTAATPFVQEIGDRAKEEENFLSDQEISNLVRIHSKKDSTSTDWDSESILFEHAESVTGYLINSHSDGFLSDGDFGGEIEFDALMDFNGERAEHSGGEMSDLERNEGSEDFEEENSDIMEELSQLEEDLVHNPDALRSEFLSEKDFHEDTDRDKNDELGGKDDKPMNGPCDSEKTMSKDSSDTEDANKLETLWEHQELIEQLKMELRKVRATGLPTILEESESPKITEDLKPWKIEEKFQHEERMDVLDKFYRSYRERMRKFDIFNYQKMYAIGFLKLKDPHQSVSSQKISGPTLKSLLSQNFWQLKQKCRDSDPIIKFMKELQSDLEVVYVGQMCLSWEFLHWQYGKALDLWDSDPRGVHRYNQVAGEFQQFQVLMQRFIEDEPFQAPRVQYYTKSRCVNRNLLQVPAIRENNLKERRKARKSERAEYAITSDMLVEIMEESIRILWRFIQADKDSCSVIVKGHKAKPMQLQNPGDLELLMEVRNLVQKKEKKLKELRSGNCILRRFRNCREDESESDQVLYFFSQVDMKLVSRVLNMSKITTDQLLWCHSKLSKISFDNRKIQVEPSFLLFPC